MALDLGRRSTAASVAGCQRGAWSLSTITALMPS